LQHNKRPLRQNAPRIAAALVALAIIVTAPVAHAAERALSFAVSGVVANILVKPGQRVKAGQALAELDRTKINARLKAGRAAQAAAKIDHEIAQRRYDYAREQFEAVSLSKAELDESELAMAEAQAKRARIDAKVEIAEWYLARMTLRAPIAASVVKVPGYPGMVVSLKAAVTPVVVVDMP